MQKIFFGLLFEKVEESLLTFRPFILFSSNLISIFIFAYESSVIRLHKNSVHFSREVKGRKEKNLSILEPLTHYRPSNYGRVGVKNNFFTVPQGTPRLRLILESLSNFLRFDIECGHYEFVI
jgi:hypothetical protein